MIITQEKRQNLYSSLKPFEDEVLYSFISQVRYGYDEPFSHSRSQSSCLHNISRGNLILRFLYRHHIWSMIDTRSLLVNSEIASILYAWSNNKLFKNLKGYRINVAIDEYQEISGELPYDGTAELWWDSLEEMQEDFASPEGKAAGADADTFTVVRTHIYTREHILK